MCLHSVEVLLVQISHSLTSEAAAPTVNAVVDSLRLLPIMESEVHMPDIKKNSPQQPSREQRRSEEAIDEQLEKDADEMAGKAQEVQKRNEEEQGIFTK
jgi:hypothetical protein